MSILLFDMSLPNNIDPLKSNPGTRYPGPSETKTPDRSRCAATDAGTGGLTQQRERKPQRCECAPCMYYDPERTYCTYIHAPVDILFVCPLVLDNRR